MAAVFSWDQEFKGEATRVGRNTSIAHRIRAAASLRAGADANKLDATPKTHPLGRLRPRYRHSPGQCAYSTREAIVLDSPLSKRMAHLIVSEREVASLDIERAQLFESPARQPGGGRRPITRTDTSASRVASSVNVSRVGTTSRPGPAHAPQVQADRRRGHPPREDSQDIFSPSYSLTK